MKRKRLALLCAYLMEATKPPGGTLSKQLDRDLEAIKAMDNSDDIFRMAKEVLKLLEVK